MNAAQEDRLKAIREEQKKLKEAILAMKKKDSKKEEPEDKAPTALDEIRAKYLAKKRRSRRPDESQLLEKLEMFQKSLREVPEGVDLNKQPEEEEDKEEEGEDEEKEEEEDSNFNDPNWKYHLLKFKKEPKVIDPMTRDDQYTTFDPLKFSKVKPLSQHQRRLMTKKNMDEW